jgi:AcrR family transcriptional regulator
MVATTSRLPAPDRRESILVAAAKRFAGHGYDATTLDEIAAAAGVTKPILYRHFGSKQDLYLALLARHAGDMPGFVSPIPRCPDGRIDLGAILDPWLAYAQANRHGWRMLFRDAGGGEEIVAYRRAVRRRAREVVAGFLVAAGTGLADAELQAAAEIVRAGLAGLVLWWAENPDVPREVLVAAAVRILDPIIAG